MQSILSKSILFFILLFVLSSFNTSYLHPLHVSTTEIIYNSKQKNVEITCKLFTDDFENALRKENNGKIDLIAPVMHNEMDAVIKKYIQSRLQITVNNQKLKQNYIGYEIDREVVIVYMEIESVKPFEKININNRILYDFFEDQMNIVHVEHLGKRKSGRLNAPDTKLEFKF